MERSARQRPHILIIHADQHRADCIGAYGHPDVRTPHIDRLASEGVRYESCYCPLPVCTPSRYSMLTGLYPHQHLGRNNRCTLPAGLDTFPRLLRDQGYRTTAVGKMHCTPTCLDIGFERMTLAEQDGGGRFEDDYHRFLEQEGLTDEIDRMDQVRAFRERAPQEYWDTLGAMESNLDEAHHSTTWIADRAVEELDRWTGTERQLLMVGFIKPHHPFDPPAPWSGMYDPEGLTLPSGWIPDMLPLDEQKHPGYFPNARITEPQLRRVMAYYYASISQIDFHVGRMIAALERKGLYDDTLILYTGDHGEYLGYHHLLLKGNYMYEPLMRIPLVIKYPGGQRAGETAEGLFSNVDIAPTLLRQAGCMPGAWMRGTDLSSDDQGAIHRICRERTAGRIHGALTLRQAAAVSGRRAIAVFRSAERSAGTE